VVSHTGVSPEHWALDVHPGMHVKVRGLQMGFAVPQSELFRQAAHLPVAATQRGADGGQSWSMAQATQLSVFGSQILLFPWHGFWALHPMQAWIAVSQVGVEPEQSASAVQAA
jgi:hypothetical protein